MDDSGVVKRRPSWLQLAALLALLFSLACGPCNLLSAEVPTPPRPIVVSTESAAQLESRIQQNLGGEPGGQFILRMSDEEVTSLVATKLAQYDESPVTEPQIWFTKGKIYGTGRLVNVMPVDTPFYVVTSARIVDGQVEIVVEDVEAGALPIPEGVVDTLSQSVNETLQEVQLDVEVTAIEVLEGEIVVKGVRQ
ncbi:MAG: hypothetical protein JXA93_19535 [Anaerolineae bacterium]|nr:hypothetical protein [Anaerolineae bacterium]